MKVKRYLLLILIIITLFSTVACKQNDAAHLIIGAWLLDASSVRPHFIIDNYEVDYTDNEIYTFNSDGTGIQSVIDENQEDGYEFTHTINKNELYIVWESGLAEPKIVLTIENDKMEWIQKYEDYPMRFNKYVK